MKKLASVVFAGCLLLLGASAAWAPCPISGYVYCDVNQSGTIDEGDTALANVGVLAGSDLVATTDADGYYEALAHEVCGRTLSLDETTLPDDAVFIDPETNGAAYYWDMKLDWLIDSEICHPQEEGLCWATAGGVKFDSVTRQLLAEHGPRDTFGGVAFPGCSPEPSEGCQWNHLAHRDKLHFQGWSCTFIECGNVLGYEPGSESPVTDYNYIEFEGNGTLKGIHGNKMKPKEVYFFIRLEDGNEPGQEGNSNAGEDLDRYFLHVFSDEADPAGTTELLIDVDGDPTTVDPITITGGNLQLHKCQN